MEAGAAPAGPASYEYSKFRADRPLHCWDATAEQFGHLWYPQEGRKSDICSRCKHKFSRMNNDGFKCAACHKRIHTKCTDVADSSACRPTFEKVVPPHFEPEHPTIHHWVAGIFDQAKNCDVCKKSVRAIMGSTVSLRCAWCKRTIHKTCFEGKADAWGECDMGALSTFILPSTAILFYDDVPDERTAASTDDRAASVPISGSGQVRALDLRVSSRVAVNMEQSGLQRTGSTRSNRSIDSAESDSGAADPLSAHLDTATMSKSERQQLIKMRRPSAAAAGGAALGRFVIVPPPNSTPLIVFINPASGGNQGVKLISHFQWVLNPRQIFNLMARPDPDGKPVGPRRGLEIYKDVPNLRILVCGGDGTVGWLLETLDNMGLSSKNIPVGTIPLGTGNDLARALKFGGGYTEGTSIQKLLLQFRDAAIVRMDRWSIEVTTDEEPSTGAHEDEEKIEIVYKLPQTVFNNYFSIGSDAYTALKFHLARQANPHKFDSRFRNKFEYAIVGGKDLIRHRFKNLSADIELICDGQNYTDLIRRKQVEALALLNINSYAAGTNPWGTKNAVEGFDPPRMDDGKVEVVGFCSSWDFPKGQLGLGHALRICQAHEILIRTTRPLPMQVDGEPCMLAPSKICISLKNQATMLGRAKGRYRNAETVASLEAPAARADLITDDSDEEAEASSSSASHFLALSEEDAPSEDDQASANICSIKVYLVPMDDSGRAGGLRDLGNVDLPAEYSLANARSEISTTLSVKFDFNAGWRYLQYKRSPEQGQPGAYFVLTLPEEQHTTIASFARPAEKIKPGLFVTQLPEASEVTQSPQAEFLAAAVDGSIEEVARLLDQGVAVDTVDSAGQTALHLAARNNRLGVMLCLLRYNIDPNVVDRLGRTALHCAAESGHRSGVEVLIESGAHIHLSDCHGQRPQDLALHAHHDGIYELLANLERSAANADTEKHPDLETVV